MSMEATLQPRRSAIIVCADSCRISEMNAIKKLPSLPNTANTGKSSSTGMLERISVLRMVMSFISQDLP